MGLFQLLVAVILPYLTVLVVVVGLVYRIRRWQKAAVGNMALYPASSSSRGEMWRKVLGEIALFSSFRKEHRDLWARTWFLHVSLVVIVLGHSRLVTDWPLRVLLGMSAASVQSLSAWSGGILGLVAMLACALLLYRRLTVRRVREISTGEDYLVMSLLLLILITGNIIRFFGHFDVTVAQTYFASLVTFGPIRPPADPTVLLHFLLVQMLLIYLPFGKLLHVPGIFFSKPLLAKDY
jgi:nitrate reductase gamma subunit